MLSAYPKKEGKVGIVTAGGSGHLPLFLGYVGQGMLDGCAVGNVFASPSAQKMADMIRACDSGRGVLCLFGNYGGDKMNFEIAREQVEFDDIKTTIALGTDDVASSPKETAEKRR
ncbi:MAG: dihydroxyacetone kinase subunit DhaK, partial [Treponema sp.]|nr:dihydroxyacetone kinase subunit DhaK [Treponema sp.]